MIDKYSIFNGAKCFSKNGLQNILVYQPSIKYFKLLINNYTVKEWVSEGLSNRSFRPLSRSNNSLNLRLDYFNDPIFRIFLLIT